MTDRYEQKKQRPWLQYVTLGIATLAMAFSAIAAFHPFGLGETSRPNMTQQTGALVVMVVRWAVMVTNHSQIQSMMLQQVAQRHNDRSDK